MTPARQAAIERDLRFAPQFHQHVGELLSALRERDAQVEKAIATCELVGNRLLRAAEMAETSGASELVESLKEQAAVASLLRDAIRKVFATAPEGERDG